jgi:hypothetical protein
MNNSPFPREERADLAALTFFPAGKEVEWLQVSQWRHLSIPPA